MAVPAATHELLDKTDFDAFFPTINGSPTAVADEFGNDGVRFDGVNDGYDYDAGLLTTGSDHTFSCWVKFPTLGGSENGIFGQNGQVGDDRQFQLRKDIDDKHRWIGYGATASDFEIYNSGATTVPLDTWEHLIVSLEPNDPLIFRNGVDVTTLASSGGAGYTTIDGTIEDFVMAMSQHDAANFFEFDITRFRVWDGTALTAAQKLEHYNNELAILNGGITRRQTLLMGSRVDRGR